MAAAEQEYISSWLAYTGSALDLFLEMRGHYLEERRREGSEGSVSRPSAQVPKNFLRELEAEEYG